MAQKNKTLKSLRLSEENQATFTKLYGSIYAGATYAAEGFLAIRQQTLKELKGKFTREEWLCLIDTQNGLLIYPDQQARKALMIMEMEDAEKLDAVGKRFEVADYPAFMKKLDNLTAAQVFFLQDEIKRFWDDEERNLDTFIQQYL